MVWLRKVGDNARIPQLVGLYCQDLVFVKRPNASNPLHLDRAAIQSGHVESSAVPDMAKGKQKYGSVIANEKSGSSRFPACKGNSVWLLTRNGQVIPQTVPDKPCTISKTPFSLHRIVNSCKFVQLLHTSIGGSQNHRYASSCLGMLAIVSHGQNWISPLINNDLMHLF